MRTSIRVGAAAVLLALGVAMPSSRLTLAAEPTTQAIDWDRARSLYQKEQRGDRLTEEEQAYLKQAKAARARSPRGGGAAAAAPAEPRATTGLIPLTDIKDDARYKEQEGGLYGGGRNEPPATHKQAALAAAARIAPLNADGQPAPEGKIVLLSIGMSNTTQEFSRFQQLANRDQRKNPQVILVDGAQGGRDAPAWLDPRQGEQVWQEADRRLLAAGVTLQQVQVVWIKQALMGPARYGDFPKHADVLRDDLVQIVLKARKRYPNLRVAYLSSRIYAGYAGSPLNPEPYAYEGAFAVRSAIQLQVSGEQGLGVGEGAMPVMLWGPYLWTDGTKGRAGDKVVWERQDVGSDGTHPSDTGREKVAQMLLNFLTTDETARSWFMRPVEKTK